MAFWSTIAEAEVLQELSPSEQTILKALAGAVDNLPAILTTAINQARGLVSTAGADLGADGTIADSLRPEVIAIARWRWLLSLPAAGKSLQTQERKDAYTDALKRIDEVAKGKVGIESPTTGAFSAAGDFGTHTKIAMRTDI